MFVVLFLSIIAGALFAYSTGVIPKGLFSFSSGAPFEEDRFIEEFGITRKTTIHLKNVFVSVA